VFVVVVALIASLAVAQTIPPADTNLTDRSCANFVGDNFALCLDANANVALEEPSIDPDTAALAAIQLDAQAEANLFIGNFAGITGCPLVALNNLSANLALQIAAGTAKVTEAQNNITMAIQQAVANWMAEEQNFSQVIQMFNQTGTEPTGLQKIELFIVGWTLQVQRRVIEIDIFFARSMLAIANFYIQELTAEKAVVDALIARNCSLPDLAAIQPAVLAVIVQRKIFEYRARQLAALATAFRARWTILYNELTARARLIEARAFQTYAIIRISWEARKAYFEDAIRRAVIAFLANQGVLNSVTVTISLDPLSVKIIFTRIPPASEDLTLLREFIRRFVKTTLASLSGANEDTGINVVVSLPSKKRQSGQQSYTVSGQFQGSASALAMSLTLLFAIFLARFF